MHIIIMTTTTELLNFGGNYLNGTIPAEVCGLWGASLGMLATGDPCSESFAYGGLTCPDKICCPGC